MTHHLRKKLQSDLKHALFYTGRLFMQTVSNFWETSKGQQLITLALLAIISVFINIYFGLITVDKASINIRSVISISGVLLLLFLLVNFIRAPFQLDREREDEIKSLKQGNPQNGSLALANNSQIQSLQETFNQKDSELLQIKKQFEPKIEILFEQNEKYRKSSGNRNQEVFIGVKNTSSSTISNLKVEIEELKIDGVIYHDIPLRKMHDKLPYKTEFTLTPNEEMLFQVVTHFPKAEEFSVVGSFSSQPIKICVANENIPHELEFAEHIIQIVAKGNDTLPCKAILPIGTWKGGTLRVGNLEKPKNESTPFPF